MRIVTCFICLPIFFFASCENTPPTLYQLKQKTGIDFSNDLVYTEDFNPYTYRNFYNGGGVALGDINNDGLTDVYFTGNMVDNKLYLNLGDWKFKDISSAAGVSCSGVWSSGVAFADVNGDGYLDIYICKSGKPEGANRHNELFINNGNLTFTESAEEYGLDVLGLSTHAAFFDYDKDGDLDCYILTNSVRSIGAFDFIKDQRNIPDSGGNKFMRNDNGKFTDITTEAGFYSSKIGFGLGITLSDFNEDGWTDVFVSNDFFERDYLYINDRQGKFTEELEKYFSSTSMGSMGADAADINNDQRPDLMVTEMLPATLERVRSKTVFESWDKYQLAVSTGYFHQFSRNVLQQNIGSRFIEIGRYSGLSATEWSWASLVFDMDNDGLKDIYVSNGIYKDLLDRDYLTFTANEENIRAMLKEKDQVIRQLVDIMPSSPVNNQAFKNTGDFNFENVSGNWGFSVPSFSNGSAYGDLDNDGDLDLIVNNVNMPSFVFENTLNTPGTGSLRVKLKGKGLNTFGIGAKVLLFCQGSVYSVENYPSRGFESSVDPVLHFGLGSCPMADSVYVAWPTGALSKLYKVPTGQLIEVDEHDAPAGKLNKEDAPQRFEKVILGISFTHKENNFVDFDRERLLFQMMDNEGPAIAIADVNADENDDMYIGGAKDASGALIIQEDSGFKPLYAPFDHNKISEETSQLFFDADNDGDRDLYIGCGGRAFSSSSLALMDRLYLNDGRGNFSLAQERLPFKAPFSTSAVVDADIDADGDRDLFVGERFLPFFYGRSVRGYILENDGRGYFRDATEERAPGLLTLPMTTDAKWADINADGSDDLILATEWGPVKVFLNKAGNLTDATHDMGLSTFSGWWNTVQPADVDHDGDLDILAGNHGRNSFFKDSVRLYVSDFDNNGSQDHIFCFKINGKYYPIADRDELVGQLPFLKKKILRFSDYASMDINDLLDAASLAASEIWDANTLASSVFINEAGTFRRADLPQYLQYSPVYAICAEDVNQDGFEDFLFGGNQYMVKPRYGRYDALPVAVWYGNKGFPDETKIELTQIFGQVRDLKFVTFNKKRILVVAKNNESIETFIYK